MPSIRIRIILLTFFSLLFLLFAIVNEYLHVKEDVQDSKKSLHIVEKISFVSHLIHSLQKERGLTATHLVKQNKEFHDKLIKQRELTDIQLSDIENSFLFKDKQNFVDLKKEIDKIRNIVDNEGVTWKIVKEFYTVEIDRLLTEISLELTELGYQKEISHQLYAVIYLLKARENLGILRADISRSYEKNKLSQSEILEISYKYSIFIDKFHYFESHINKTPCDNIKKHLNDEFLKPVKTQITSIVEKQKNLNKSSSILWWKEATSIIDSMKEAEDLLFSKIKEFSQNNIQTNERKLSWYISVAFLSLLVISILAISTVVCILRELSVLTNSLNEVEKTQDFGLRVNTKSNGEFGKLGHSVNKLLNYTDQIIKEKEKLASVDLLTGVMNRRSFIDVAEKEIERSNRYKKPLSLIFCDIDNFKFINDTYGHNVGDEVLKSFSNIISLYIRKNDYLARWGGEEFLVLAPETNEAQATELAESLRKMTEKLCMQKINGITCSFGVAEIKPGESLESLHKRADDAMYRAKELGRNQVCVASDNQLIA